MAELIYLRKSWNTKEEAEKKLIAAKRLYTNAEIVEFNRKKPLKMVHKGKKPNTIFMIMVSDHK